MSNKLYSALRTLLPPEYVGGNTTLDYIEGATRYIKEMEQNVKELEDKLEKSKNSSNSLEEIEDTTSSSISNSINHDNYVIVQAQAEAIFDIKFSVVVREGEVFPLSAMLKVINEEGLDVVSCNLSSKAHQRRVYVIHCQIDEDQLLVDPTRLQSRLTSEIASYISITSSKVTE